MRPVAVDGQKVAKTEAAVMAASSASAGRLWWASSAGKPLVRFRLRVRGSDVKYLAITIAHSE